MKEIKWMSNESFPLEMHKARVVQKLNLLEPQKRLEAIKEAGFNTFLLKNRDVFLDMLTDSGVNAMSDKQQAAMLQADDSYAGSETFFRLEAAVRKMFGQKFFLPAHQGRACEHIIAKCCFRFTRALRASRTKRRWSPPRVRKKRSASTD